ncbi:zinc finger MYM-type protein 4-like [Pholidichthys leucotaenia]
MPLHNKTEESNVCFSDDDEGMNMDFDMDIDTDEDVPSKKKVTDDNSNDSTAKPVTTEGEDTKLKSEEQKKKVTSVKGDLSDRDQEEIMDFDQDDDDGDVGGDDDDWMDEDMDRGSSATLNAEKKSNLSAGLTQLKRVKIVVPKLDVTKLKGTVHVSQFLSSWEMQQTKDQLTQKKMSKTSSALTDITNNLSSSKTAQMSCSYCKKGMMKGHTAFQKKGFTDVFCSKNCLFEMFPQKMNKTCYYCCKAILQPLDIVMSAVDNKGTMKEFCSPACLCFFKYSSTTDMPKGMSFCSVCHKRGKIKCELTLNGTVYKLCSIVCLEVFCRENVGFCEKCGSNCPNKPLMLKLGSDTKTICSEECLQKFKEEIKMTHQCTNCCISVPASRMVHHKNDDNMVELFCNGYCMTSYKLRPTAMQVKKMSTLNRSSQQTNTEDEMVKSAVNDDGSPAAAELDRSVTAFLAAVPHKCHNCQKGVSMGQTVFQPRGSAEVFCSSACILEKYPHYKLVTKKCHNCFQVIALAQKVILAPVDDLGTMKELCSNTCLASFQSKHKVKPSTPRFECGVCRRYHCCKFKVTLDGAVHRLCSDACFITFRKTNNLSVSLCDMCTTICSNKQHILKMKTGTKTLCSDECLVKFKARAETYQLCLMCQTAHLISDMVESPNDEGRLDLFCSNRCMNVYKSQILTPLEIKSLPFDEEDMKEVKQILLNLDCIKEEPIDEEYDRSLQPSVSPQSIKDEPDETKEDLQINSLFSSTEKSKLPKTEDTQKEFPLCSSCKKVVMEGETFYQRKSCSEIFCSNTCLLNFYEEKTKLVCHFCLQEITQLEDVIQSPVDDDVSKDFCSQNCLSSFIYKKVVSTKVPIVSSASQSECSMCGRQGASKLEVSHQNVPHKICSTPCFLRFCNLNHITICENCSSHCISPLKLKMDSVRNVCNEKCLDQFRQKIKTQQPCSMCSTSKPISEMIENRNSENVVELFCTSSCVMASKIQAFGASGAQLNCDHCGKKTAPACHLAMSDSSIRNFCSLTCAMTFKKRPTSPTDGEKLRCVQCEQIIKTMPQVIQKKDMLNFVCSLACSQEFKKTNNITGRCDYCKNIRIIKHMQRIDGKDHNFCSDGCKSLFCVELGLKWGKHCRSCSYCLSVSKTVVMAEDEDAEEEFCSTACSSNYEMLLSYMAPCDACGHKGRLKQTLPLLGEVKHFCDFKCLHHFCNEGASAPPAPPAPDVTRDSSPVITSVISLASALKSRLAASASSAQSVSTHESQTKVVGHASVQTVPKELKNKSLLCTPLVHNKGVSCSAQTSEMEAQTDTRGPDVVVLPVPVPIYVPLPMAMYSQYTPNPLGLPIPVPVPLVVREEPDSSESSRKEKTQLDQSEQDQSLRTERKMGQFDRTAREDGQKGGEVLKEAVRGEALSVNDFISSGNLPSDFQPSLNNQDDAFFDTSLCLQTPSPAHETQLPLLDVAMVSSSLPQLCTPPPPHVEISENPQRLSLPPLKQKLKKVNRKCFKGQLFYDDADTSQKKYSEVVSGHKLKSQCGVDAWVRWIKWRESLKHLGLVLSPTVTLKSDILLCSATELSYGLCYFIKEVKQPDRRMYPPDRLFYLCLSIQQHLLQNGRVENIFNDLIYSKFTNEFTKILKQFISPGSASSSLDSCIEEEYLWEGKQLGAYSPVVLLNTLLFFFTKFFGFTTVEQHRRLSFANITSCTTTNQDNTTINCLRFYPSSPTNDAESDTFGVPSKKQKKNESEDDFLEIMENTENPFRCPVRLFEFYLFKCSAAMEQHSDLFYLQPDLDCVPNSPLWFSDSPLEDSTMEAMIIRILTVRELAQGDT